MLFEFSVSAALPQAWLQTLQVLNFEPARGALQRWVVCLVRTVGAAMENGEASIQTAETGMAPRRTS